MNLDDQASIDQELHNADLSRPGKRSLISLTKIKQALESGNSALLDRRFSFGRENDVHPDMSIMIEESGLHVPEPYGLDLKTMIEKSRDHGQVELMRDIASNLRNEDERRISIKTSYSLGTGWDDEFDEDEVDSVIVSLKEKLKWLYSLPLTAANDMTGNLVEVQDDLTALSLYKEGWTEDSKFRDDKNIITNTITVLDNAFVSNRDLVKLNRTYRFADVISMWRDPEYANVSKEDKKQAYFVTSGKRPDAKSYHEWNGFQVFDLDLKNSKTPNIRERVVELKEQIHTHLCNYSWYVGITLSSSRNGLHIYTKVQRPHHLFDHPTDNEDLCKFWFRMAYVNKYAIVRWVLTSLCKIDISENTNKAVIDFAMARITQGIKISHDVDALVNPNFEDLPIMATFHQGPTDDLQDWLFNKNILENKTFVSWMTLYNNAAKSENVYEAFEAGSGISKDDYIIGEIEEDSITRFDGELHYSLRWNVVNTLASLFGENGRKWAHYVLRSREARNEKEIEGFFNAAIANSKPPSNWGLQVLKKCGFSIVMNSTAQDKLNETFKDEIRGRIEAGAKAAMNERNDWSKHLPSNEYIGNHTDELLEEFEHSKVNLLISPPGTGKTEFVKNLSKNSRVLLVLPYISVIDAKVVKDMSLGEHFDAFVGSRPLDELSKGRSAVMTIDKFGNLDVEKYSYIYDYVIIDESHLMFTSSYRIEAMSKALKNVKKLIVEKSMFETSAPKVVMMTGTPTGEIAYFGFYNKLKTFSVTKTENRKKEAKFVLCNDSQEQMYLIAKHISASISDGRKVMFPTNKGDVQAIKLVGMIEHTLGRNIKWGYYKKSNWNSELNININDNATVADYDLILATNYLSVGIDINDMNDFEIVYDDSFKGPEIEQFNCRLRKVDISSTVYIPMFMGNGDINQKLMSTESWRLDMNLNDRQLVRDFIDISNKKMALSISYDPITNRIWTPGFKVENGIIVFDLEEHELIKFEERYEESMCAPYQIAKTLSGYGYAVQVELSEKQNAESISNVIGAGLEAAKLESDILNEINIDTVDWMFHNNTYKNAHNVEINNLVTSVWKEGTAIIEDKKVNKITVEEDFLGNVQAIRVPNAKIWNESYGIATRFLSMYSPETSWHLFSQCMSTGGKMVKAEVQRYMRLISFVKAEEKGIVGEEIYSLMRNIYDMIERHRYDESAWMENEEYEAYIDSFTQFYLDQLGLKLRTDKMKQKYRSEVAELFNILTIKRRKNKGISLEFRLLPTPDNEARSKRKQFDAILMQIFEIGDTMLPGQLKQQIRERHLNEDMLAGLSSAQSEDMTITM